MTRIDWWWFPEFPTEEWLRSSHDSYWDASPMHLEGPVLWLQTCSKSSTSREKLWKVICKKKKNEATLEKWGICSLVTRGAWRKAKVSPCFLSLIFLAIIRDVTNLDMQCCILLQSKDAYFSCRNFWSAHLHVFYLFAGYLNKILSKVLQLSWEDLGSPEVECRTSFQTMSEHVRTL